MTQPKLTEESQHLTAHVSDWDAYEAGAKEVHKLWSDAMRTLLNRVAMLQPNGTYVLPVAAVESLRATMNSSYDDLDDDDKTYCRNALLPIFFALDTGDDLTVELREYVDSL